jgi:NAD dependent epimerase/dehydratase
MKNILVTGAGGFIGSHLTEKLVKLGYNVRVLVRYNSKNDRGWLEQSSIKNDIEFITGDVRDYDTVYGAVNGCDTVFHLAALIGIPYSYVSPLAYIRTNIEGTYNVMQSSKELGVENILSTSTSETYGTAQYVPINEEHPLVGQSPYSATKIGADQLALSYNMSFDTPVKVVRPFNTYGPRQSARAVIPTIITQILSGKKEIKLGSLSPTRDFTFVKDTAAGFLAIAETDKFNGKVTNIGMNEEISIGDLVRLIAEIIGEDITVTADNERIRPENSEVERLVCDNTKLKESTDWTAQYNLRKGLTETVEFLKENMAFYKPDIYNI